ncbi:MAG: hypothetical protein ACFFD2_21870 [Promethearchaeota archaeon]
MTEMGEVNKFMAEIIRLLTDLVAAVKRNEDLITETQNIMKNSQIMIENLSQSAGMRNIMTASQSLENAIAMLQKGVQTMEIHNALRQVQEFLCAMGSVTPSTEQDSGVKAVSQQDATISTPQEKVPLQKSENDDSLVKPSDLFK